VLLHIVLFRPRSNVTAADRDAMFLALGTASTAIPSVRRFEVGRRVTHGAAYERLMSEDFPYAAVVEFEDLDGLTAYLNHPEHEQLGELFSALCDRALAYDYQTPLDRSS
jgi:hypothetical protein